MACDEAYAMPLATSIRSLVEANRSWNHPHVFVLTSHITDSTKKQVTSSLPWGAISIEWIHVDLLEFSNFSILSYLSTTTYARLLLPYVIPNDITRILYLDADVLVLDDLEPLWNTAMEDVAVGAVVDVWSTKNWDRLMLQTNSEDTLSEPDINFGAYFNAGVMLVDLARWRRDQISERALAYLRRYPQSPLSDQDALNVACSGRWMQLDRRWNCHYGDAVQCISSVEQKPAILHFAGKWKPWQARNLSRNALFYDEIRSRTQFARGFWEKTTDVFARNWMRIKRQLKQYPFVFFVYRFVIRRKVRVLEF
jgi:lipopolysaccharide biosynthesis glycosyltransferase